MAATVVVAPTEVKIMEEVPSKKIDSGKLDVVGVHGGEAEITANSDQSDPKSEKNEIRIRVSNTKLDVDGVDGGEAEITADSDQCDQKSEKNEMRIRVSNTKLGVNGVDVGEAEITVDSEQSDRKSDKNEIRLRVSNTKLGVDAVNGGEAETATSSDRSDRKSEKNRVRIQVSNTKKPVFFYINLAKRYIKQCNEVELSALGMAIPTVITISEFLKRIGLAVEKHVSISTVSYGDENRKGRRLVKAQIAIVLGIAEKQLGVTKAAVASEKADDNKA